MTTANIYLHFNDNCKEVFDFYKSVFGGEFSFVGTYADMPIEEGMPPLSEADQNKIMHIGLPISNETILMGSDAAGEWSAEVTPGNNFSISVSTESKEKTNELFAKLSQNGEVTMPLEDTFWGDYFGSCIDQFGISWMVSFNAEQKL